MIFLDANNMPFDIFCGTFLYPEGDVIGLNGNQYYFKDYLSVEWYIRESQKGVTVYDLRNIH